MIGIFRPPPATPTLPPEQLGPQRKYWRVRQLYATFFGYAIYYFVRKNLPFAMPLMSRDLGLSKVQLGIFLTLPDIVYGVSKFVNGILADRANARYFMAAGLFLSALANLAFGLSSGLTVMAIFWVANGWFQGMGFPPCARILSHWFAPRERGTMWGIWNTSHMVGAFGIAILGGFLGEHYGWRAVFVVPAILAILTSLFLVERLRDTPESLGIPPIGEDNHPQLRVEKEAVYADLTPAPLGSRNPEVEAGFGEVLRRRVFGNPYIWAICAANFFVYVVRMSFLNWAPTYLSEVKHIPLSHAGGMTGTYELAGLLGSLVAGWLTDRFFARRRAPVCVLYMLGTLGFIYMFWAVPQGHPWLDAISLAMVGFCIYGPQFLVGVMTADLVGKEAAATAIGLTGFFGYLSGLLSGIGLGALVQTHGWNAGFSMLCGCCLAAAVPFALCWKTKPREEQLV